MGTLRWKKYTIELLPIKVPTPNELYRLESLINQYFTSEQESHLMEIEEAIMNCYDLNLEEKEFILSI